MLGCVLDASVTLPWLFHDEATGYTSALLKKVAEAEAWVPSIWPYEIVNATWAAERRGRVTPPQIERFLHELRLLPIRVERLTPVRVFEDVSLLCRDFRLTAYDAAYSSWAVV